MLRLSSEDDIREDLDLAVMELQDRFGVATSSIRRYVNAAIRATADRDGVRATKFLRQRSKREQEPFEAPSGPIGGADSAPRPSEAAREAS